MMNRAAEQADPPMAEIRAARPVRWFVWLIPAAAALFIVILLWAHVLDRGPVITIRMAEGHGIKAGDVLRCRGVVVGEVESAGLGDDLDGVVVRVRLSPDARDVARAGSRFWVVRPRLDLAGATGLETIAGPRYLAVLPGRGERQREFIALERAPAVDSTEAGGLEITLVADRRGGLQRGATVAYRQVPIGTILSVGLASDGASVEARAYIDPQYTALVRTGSRFWSTGGAAVSLGLRGVRADIDSLETLLVGGVAVATPEEPGDEVRTGHRFTLHEQPDDDWLAWRPALAVGSRMLPPGAPRPALLRATLEQRTGRLWRRTQRRHGWVLPTPGGIAGPADLLSSEDSEATLELAGQRLALDAAPPDDATGILILTLPDLPAGPAWPAERTRDLEEPEDLLIFTDAATPPLAIAAARLGSDGDGRWRIAPTLSFEPDLNGAAAVARDDGMIVGLLRVSADGAWIAALP